MSAFTPAMEAELRKPFATVFGALKIELPGKTLCLIDGAGSLAFGGDTYTGMDSTFGTIQSVAPARDGVGDEAPTLSITLLPSDDAAAAEICSPTMQGSPVTLYLGAVDPETGGVIADPLAIFSGELDQPVLNVDKGARELDYECVSAFERLFSGDEGARLSDSFHKSIWPGEDGLSNVSGVQRNIYWGVDRPKGTVSYGGGGFGGGGQGGFNVDVKYL